MLFVVVNLLEIAQNEMMLDILVKRQGCLSKYASRAQKVSQSVANTVREGGQRV